MKDDENNDRSGRVWDRFLTERDRRHLERGWQKQRSFGLGSNAALLVIDNTRDVAGDASEDLLEAMTTSPTSCGTEGWQAIQRTKALLDAARTRGVFVAHTILSNLIPTGINQRFGRGGESAYSFHPDSLPLTEELVVEKSHASAFNGTALSGHLVARGIGSIVVCGNSTSGCVRASVVDAAACGFRVAVVEDCVFDRTEAAHAINLFDMHLKYADVISMDEALEFISQVAVPPGPGGSA